MKVCNNPLCRERIRQPQTRQPDIENASSNRKINFVVDVSQFSTIRLTNAEIDRRLQGDTIAAKSLTNIRSKFEAKRRSPICIGEDLRLIG